MIRPIKIAGDPILKQVAHEVERIDKKVRRLLDDMAETMYAKDGIGIAAPQVGVSLRICVVDVDQQNRFELINPVIVERIGSEVATEGCLSCPKLTGTVERAATVKVKFLNRFGKPKVLTASGLLARCLQHEIDHLDGKLFIDSAVDIVVEP